MMELICTPSFWYAVCVVAIVVFAVFVIKGYLKRLSSGCCGGGDAGKVKKVRIRDRNKAHYPHTVTLTVDGMVCGGCKTRVENALNQLDGVWASADVPAKKVTVRLKQPVDEQTLRDAVNRTGAYTVMAVTKQG